MARTAKKAAQTAAEPLTPPAEEVFTDEDNACCRHKMRTDEERRSLVIRLNRIEGQVRGLRRMVENDVYCPDILVQVAATSAALNGFSRELLEAHLRTCVVNDIRSGKDATVDELLDVLQKLMK